MTLPLADWEHKGKVSLTDAEKKIVAEGERLRKAIRQDNLTQRKAQLVAEIARIEEELATLIAFVKPVIAPVIAPVVKSAEKPAPPRVRKPPGKS